MNAGILILQDGTPCIAYDQQLPHLIKHVEFDPADYQIMLIYDIKGGAKSKMMKQGKKFEFPLDHGFVKLLDGRKNIAVACIQQGQLFEIKLYPLIMPGKKNR